ncbi:MAG: metal-dependent hydrolase [Holophagales bacterium]|nr:metal-dependent hydrolase [Holophagales bacterium]
MNRTDRPKFTFLGHSTVRCDLPGGEVVLIEAWVGGNPACPEGHRQLDRLDAMLITHAHPDHMADAVELAQTYEPKVVVATFEICSWLESKGVKGCSGMNIGGSQTILDGKLKVSQTQAVHTSAIFDGDQMIYGGTASGFAISLENGYTFYHAGDTCLFSDMQLLADLYRPHLAFLPIGDHFTMDPYQAAIACKFLEAREVVPIHWGTFPVLTGTPAQLEAELSKLGVNCKVVALEPGDDYTPSPVALGHA